MAAYTSATSSAATAFSVNCGRSGYNSKPDEEESQPPKDKGRSGYNK